MRFFATLLGVIVIAVIALASPLFAAGDRVLTIDGLRPVRIGMTVAAAQRALHAKLVALQGPREDACWYAARAGGVDPGIAYMVERGRITRIDVWVPRQGKPSAVTSRSGIGIGTAEDEITRRHGADAFEPHPIAPHGRWALLEHSDKGGVRVSITEGRVTGLWAGRRPALDYSEGCS